MKCVRSNISLLLLLSVSPSLAAQGEAIHKSSFEGGPNEVVMQTPEGVPSGWGVSSTAGISLGSQLPVFLDSMTFAVAEEPGPGTRILMSAVAGERPVFSYAETAMAAVFAHPIFFDMNAEDRRRARESISGQVEFESLVAKVAAAGGLEINSEEMLDAVIDVWKAPRVANDLMKGGEVVGSSSRYTVADISGGLRVSRKPNQMHGVGVVFEEFTDLQGFDVLRAAQQNTPLGPVARVQTEIISADPRSFADEFNAMIFSALSGGSSGSQSDWVGLETGAPTLVRLFSGMGERPTERQEWLHAWRSAFAHNAAAMISSSVVGLASYVVGYASSSPQGASAECRNLISTAASQSAAQLFAEILIIEGEVSPAVYLSGIADVFYDAIGAAATCVEASASLVIVGELGKKLAARFAAGGVQAFVIADASFSPALRVLASAYGARNRESFGWLPTEEGDVRRLELSSARRIDDSNFCMTAFVFQPKNYVPVGRTMLFCDRMADVCVFSGNISFSSVEVSWLGGDPHPDVMCIEVFDSLTPQDLEDMGYPGFGPVYPVAYPEDKRIGAACVDFTRPNYVGFGDYPIAMMMPNSLRAGMVVVQNQETGLFYKKELEPPGPHEIYYNGYGDHFDSSDPPGACVPESGSPPWAANTVTRSDTGFSFNGSPFRPSFYDSKNECTVYTGLSPLNVSVNWLRNDFVRPTGSGAVEVDLGSFDGSSTYEVEDGRSCVGERVLGAVMMY